MIPISQGVTSGRARFYVSIFTPGPLQRYCRLCALVDLAPKETLDRKKPSGEENIGKIEKSGRQKLLRGNFKSLLSPWDFFGSPVKMLILSGKGEKERGRLLYDPLSSTAVPGNIFYQALIHRLDFEYHDCIQGRQAQVPFKAPALAFPHISPCPPPPHKLAFGLTWVAVVIKVILNQSTFVHWQTHWQP